MDKKSNNSENNKPNKDDFNDRLGGNLDNRLDSQESDGIKTPDVNVLPKLNASPSGDEKSNNSSGSPSKTTDLKSMAGNAAMGSIQGTKAGEAVEKARKAQETANRAIQFAQNVQASISKITPILANPIFWIVVGVIIILIFIVMSIITATQTFGPLETECRSDGTVSVDMPETDASTEEKQNAMGAWLTANNFEFLGGKPMSKAQAAAVVGNFAAESQLGFDVTEGHVMNGASNDEVDAWTRGGARGLGLAQWTWNPGRAGNLIELAKSKGKNWYDVEIQLEMIRTELDSSYGSRLNDAGFSDANKDAGELSIIFHDIYEVSADSPERKQRRADTANEFFATFSGGGSYGQGNTTCQDVGTSVAASCSPVKGQAGYCYPLAPAGYPVTTYAGHAAEAKDIPGPEGTPLYAWGSGIVTSQTRIVSSSWCPVPGYDGLEQHEIEIKLDKPINGSETVRYAHLKTPSPLKTGTKVNAGDFIGELGNSGCSTGPHLHFEFAIGSGVNLEQFLTGLTL